MIPRNHETVASPTWQSGGSSDGWPRAREFGSLIG